MEPDPITKGKDWIHPVTVTPPDGMTDADVTTALTGASVTANGVLRDKTLVVAASAVVTSAADRIVTLTLTDDQTTMISSRRLFWDAWIITVGGLKIPLEIVPVLVREFGGAP